MNLGICYLLLRKDWAFLPISAYLYADRTIPSPAVLTAVSGVALHIAELRVTTITFKRTMAMQALKLSFTAPPVWVIWAFALSPNIGDRVNVGRNACRIHH